MSMSKTPFQAELLRMTRLFKQASHDLIPLLWVSVDFCHFSITFSSSEELPESGFYPGFKSYEDCLRLSFLVVNESIFLKMNELWIFSNSHNLA